MFMTLLVDTSALYFYFINHKESKGRRHAHARQCCSVVVQYVCNIFTQV